MAYHGKREHCPNYGRPNSAKIAREVANVIEVVPKSFMEKFGGTSALRVN
jgi:hypothetical protein